MYLMVVKSGYLKVLFEAKCISTTKTPSYLLHFSIFKVVMSFQSGFSFLKTFMTERDVI